MGHGLPLVVPSLGEAGITVLRPRGLLDSTTYRQVRDAIITAAIDQPAGVVVDATSLVVPNPTAWSALTSAHWHTSRWPGTQMALVCKTRKHRETLTRCGVSRHLPVHASTANAVAALHSKPSAVRRRRRTSLPRTSSSLHESRELMAQWLTDWGWPELISVAKLVVTVFVENVLAHTEGPPTIRLESHGGEVAVAVEDNNPAPASRRERLDGGSDDVSGLAIVGALCRSWGNAPTTSGKIVWAVIGPENQL
jgi:hypothetical protein